MTVAPDLRIGVARPGEGLVIERISSEAAVSAATAAVQFLTSATYGKAVSFGNVPGSFTFSGSGTPLDIYAPLVAYYRYTNPTGVTKTTQAAFMAAIYDNQTVDDSMECLSAFVAAKDNGVPYTQALSIAGFESHAQVEGGNHATAVTQAVGARLSARNTSTIDNGYQFYAGLVTKDVGATITNYVAFYQSPGAAGKGTNNWGVYVYDLIASESGIRVAKTGNGMDFAARIGGSGGGVPAFVHVQNPDGTDFASLRIDAIAGQNLPAIAVFDSAGAQGFTVSRLGSAITTVGFLVQNSAGTHTYGQIDNTGNFIATGLAITTDGERRNSPYLRLTGKYDSDASAAVVSAARNFDLIHHIVTAGLTPYGYLAFRNHAAAEVAYVDDLGNVRATGAVGTAHVGGTTPTGGGSGDIKVGTGKIWVNDAGTWKSAAIA